ncbi:MAG TPA: lysophospholipid acyltransferase family protein, partial [Candidatus Binataceae bacterium]|nr:lysophospholipid acyltransferase family protein [Candidatus Binataceae bacterium]
MARQIGLVRAWAECAALAPPWAMLRALPFDRAVRVGAAIGQAASIFDLHNRSIARRNLAIAFASETRSERARILRATYRNFGRMIAEWVHFFDLDRANIERYVTYQGREYWEEAIKRSAGRGILILTGHFGNFELLSLAHSIYGNRCAIVQRPNRNPLLDRAVAVRRQRFGNRTIARSGAAREVIRLLRDDWMVAVPLDLDTRHGVFVDFFGKPAATSPALARIAMATGAPVLPAFMVREGQTPRHKITFLPIIELHSNGDRRECVRASTQSFTSVIQSMIASHPDHWNWIHRRWKTRPNGEPR